MYHLIRNVFRRLRRDERGNIFVLFGASAIPLLLIMGGAVDIARYTRYKADLSNAVDAAALALARQNPDFTEAQATTFVTNYVTSFPLGDEEFTVESFDVDKVTNGFLVSATGSMHTIFLPLGKLANMGQEINSMDVNVVAEVVSASNRLELALVLDVTGSMNCASSVNSTCASNYSSPPADSRIKGLKTAAKSLVDTLMKDEILTSPDPNQIKIAVVPFEGMVNVASAGFSVTAPPTWIDWSTAATSLAQAKYNGVNFVTKKCDNTASTTLRVSHKCLFTKITAKHSTVKWAGCVEMRAGAYELSNTTPSASLPDSLYVPFFWPDEPDTNNDGGFTYQNNYLQDKVSTSENPTTAQNNVTKYLGSTITFQSATTKDVTPPYEYGPNRGCPAPIRPLANTSNKLAIKNAIDALTAFWAVGTYIPAGLIWGWHVLTPNEPYTQGIGPTDPDYPDTVKAMVLLTDGDNNVGGESNHNKSRYGAYSYISPSVGSPAAYRLGNGSTAADDALDAKTATLCGNIKTNGTPSDTSDDIRVYTISFGPALTGATKTMIENCATVDNGEKLYYHAPTNSELEDIFDEIGEDLNKLRLSM